VWGCNVVLMDHASRQMSRSLPVNSLMQSSQWVAVGVCICCCVPRHEFNVDDSFCIPEYRCPNFSSKLTHFEFFGSWRSCVFPPHSSLSSQLQYYCHWTPNSNLFPWHLTDCRAICCTLPYQVLPPTKKQNV
jgi:hypothetical protein